jgi:hypothetical protein
MAVSYTVQYFAGYYWIDVPRHFAHLLSISAYFNDLALFLGETREMHKAFDYQN